MQQDGDAGTNPLPPVNPQTPPGGRLGGEGGRLFGGGLGPEVPQVGLSGVHGTHKDGLAVIADGDYQPIVREGARDGPQLAEEHQERPRKQR